MRRPRLPPNSMGWLAVSDWCGVSFACSYLRSGLGRSFATSMPAWSMARRSRAAVGLAIGLAFVPASVRAQGGPPLITDDPDTPGPGYWEINLSTFFERNRRERRFEVPRLDLNYGVGRRVQLKYEVPWLAARPAGQPTRSGAGDSVAGVKWRFLGEEGKRMAWAVYPQLEFNTDHASVAKGLVEEGR